MSKKNTKKLEAAIDRMLKQHRRYYRGWLKAWTALSSSLMDKE